MAHILAIDDEPVVLTVLARALDEPDWVVHKAGSKAAALSVASGLDQLDLAVVDKNLGQDSGLALVSELRALHPDCEFIVITGYASTESAIEAVRLGVFEFIPKPLRDLSALRLKVKNGVDKVAARRERRRLHHELSRSEKRYRQLFDAVSDGILVSDPNTDLIEEANVAVEFLYGYDRAELRGQARSQLRAVAPENKEGAGSAMARERRKDGSAFFADIVRSPFAFDERELVIELVRDFTTVVAAREEQRRLEASKQQRERLEALGRLTAGIAHDYNNFLTIIHANGEFLRDNPTLDQQAQEDVGQIMHTTDRARNLTQQLLTVGRQNPFKSRVVDVGELASKLEPLLRTAIGEAIDLRLAIDPGPSVVLGEHAHLEQVILNLVVNARDAVETNGKIDIAVGPVQFDETEANALGIKLGPWVKVRVEDNGCGMSEETQAHIFDPFFTTKQEGRGTGLGMATVRAVVEELGGTIHLVSALGKGTAFCIYLPAMAEPASEPDQPTQERRSPPLPIRRALVAEDDAGVRRVIRRILAGEGIGVEEAADGRQAVEIIRRLGAELDLVITDVVMPRVTGPEVGKVLATVAPDVPCCYVTGHGTAVLKKHGVDPAEALVLQKPFTRPQLLRVIAEAQSAARSDSEGSG